MPSSRKPAILRVVLGFLLVWTAKAQHYSFDIYDQSVGLQNLTTQCLAQEADGSLWVGTQNGLFRYQGLRFEEFAREAGIAGQNITALATDNTGTIWVGTNVGLFRRQNKRFVRVGVSAGQIPAVRLNGIVRGASGRMWIGTVSGLVLVTYDARDVKAVETLPVPGGVSGIAVGTNEAPLFWCGGRICTSAGNQAVSVSPILEPRPNISADVLVESTGRVWARSWNHLFMREANGTRFRDVTNGIPNSSDFAVLRQSSDGTLLVPTDFGLVRRFADRWTSVNAQNGLRTNAAASVFEDKNRSLWIGLSGAGLTRWRGYNGWEGWTMAEGLASNNIWAVTRDQHHVLWVGTDSGLQRLSGIHWQKPEGNGALRKRMETIVPDPSGSLWLGSTSGLLANYDGQLHRTTVYGRQDGLTSDRVLHALLDRQANLWVVTVDSLYRGHKAGHRFRFDRIPLPGADSQSKPNRLLVDSQGALWVGGSGGHLWRLPMNGTWQHWSSLDGIAPEPIMRLAETSAGHIWIGYRADVGLSEITEQSGHLRVQQLTEVNGLSSNLALGLTAAKNGNLWLSTDNGVDQIRRTDVTHYGPEQGLIWNDCNGNALFTDDDGSIWVGTSLGLSHYNNLAVPRNEATSLVFSQVQLTGKPQGWPFQHRLENDRALSATFSSTNFADASNMYFRYRLHGLEEDWTETNLQSIRYSGLQAGSFQLQVSGRRSNKPWSRPITYSFTIAPAWWQTWLFDVLLFTAVLALMYAAWRRHLSNVSRIQFRLEQAVQERTVDLERERQMLAEQNARMDSQKRRIEQLLIQTRQSMEYKSQFLATMSHEIRTPLNGVIGMLELSLDAPMSIGQRENLEVAQSSATALLAIVNDILDLSKIEAGKLELRKASFDLRRLVQDVVALFSLAAREKQLQILCQIDGVLPPLFIGDAGRLRQVLVNLVSNALKFTEAGHVTLSVHTLPHIADEESVRFQVSDTGVGISRDAHRRIFEAFEQVDSSTSRRYGGTGLGLTIAKQLVSLMGGEFTLVSEPGKGSTFSFVLSLPPVAETNEVPVAMAPNRMAASIEEGTTRRGRQILVAEDNPINRTVIKGLLRKLGHDVILANDGLEALQILSSTRFDIAFVDIQMPNMDGLELARKVRESEQHSGEHLLMVALTANAMEGDREECLRNGLDDFLAKPITSDKLRELLSTLDGVSGMPSL